MDDEYRMEDEHEWPYLVREVKDEIPKRENKRPKDERSNEEKVADIIKSIDISPEFQKILKDKVMSLLNARDCIALNVLDHEFDSYSFVFTRENMYVKTTDEFEFRTELENPRRVFRECYTSHSHDNLLKNPGFKNLIEKTGMEFVKCYGGYRTDYSMTDDGFSFVDEIEIMVLFKAGLKERSYKLNTDEMKLSEDYFEF